MHNRLPGSRRGRRKCRLGETAITFIGHSSFLIQTAGRAVLIDPVFATRLIVLRRQRRAGIAGCGSTGDRCGAVDACAHGPSESAFVAGDNAGDAAEGVWLLRWRLCRRAWKTWWRILVLRGWRRSSGGRRIELKSPPQAEANRAQLVPIEPGEHLGRRTEPESLTHYGDAGAALGRADVQGYASGIWRIRD